MKHFERISVRKSGINGKGLFSNERIRKGQFIDYIKGPVSVVRHEDVKQEKDMENWIGVGRYSWINTNASIFRYINHSCNPNAAIRGKRMLYALKDIAKDTEITMDYSLTEPGKNWSMTCACHEKNCRKIIRSISFLKREVIEKNKTNISRNFLNIYSTDNK